MRLPPRTWAALPLALAWGALALWVGLQCLAQPLVHYDEGAQLAQAWRWAQGEALYREVWEFIAPLPLALMALVFAWVGPQVEGARLLALGFALALLWGVQRSVRQLGGGPWLAWLAALGVALGALGSFKAYYHHWLAWAFVAASCVAWGEAVAAATTRRSAWAFGVAGALGGLASLCTQSQLLLVGLAQALPLGMWLRGRAWPEVGRLLGAWALGWALPWAVVLLAFAWTGGLGALMQQLWVWPATHYRQAGGANEVWPFTDWGGTFFPFYGSGLSPWAWAVALWAALGAAMMPWAAALGALPAAGALGWAWLRGRALGPRGALALVWVGVACLALAQAVQGRADLTHFRMASVPAWVLALAWLGCLGRQAKASPSALGGALGLGGPAVGVGLLLALLVAHEGRLARQDWRSGRLDLRLTDSVLRSKALVALRPWVRPGARVQAYPGSAWLLMHSGGRPATRFTTLFPLHDRYHGPEEHAAFRADWRAHPPEVVVLTRKAPAQVQAEWGAYPDLKAYRLVAEVPVPPGEGQGLWRIFVRRAGGGPGGRP